MKSLKFKILKAMFVAPVLTTATVSKIAICKTDVDDNKVKYNLSTSSNVDNQSKSIFSKISDYVWSLINQIKTTYKFKNALQPKDSEWKSEGNKPLVYSFSATGIYLVIALLRFFKYQGNYVSLVFDLAISSAIGFSTYVVSYVSFLKQYWYYTVSDTINDLVKGLPNKKIDEINEATKKVIQLLIENNNNTAIDTEGSAIVNPNNQNNIAKFLLSLGIDPSKMKVSKLLEFLNIVFSNTKKINPKFFQNVPDKKEWGWQKPMGDKKSLPTENVLLISVIITFTALFIIGVFFLVKWMSKKKNETT